MPVQFLKIVESYCRRSTCSSNFKEHREIGCLSKLTDSGFRAGSKSSTGSWTPASGTSQNP